MNAVEQIKYDLALANRMMANEGVLDTFGHISARHPERPDRYFLSRSRAP
jgi:HCOMODA/2-hydroxy-3-carboxy-muconic semialdehyde decarboxylase